MLNLSPQLESDIVFGATVRVAHREKDRLKRKLLSFLFQTLETYHKKILQELSIKILSRELETRVDDGQLAIAVLGIQQSFMAGTLRLLENGFHFLF